MASSTDQRRDLKFMLRPASSSFGVATSIWCHDLRFFLECSFCLSNSFFVATSIAEWFGISGRNLAFLSRLHFSVVTSILLLDWFLLVLDGDFDFAVLLCKIIFE